MAMVPYAISKLSAKYQFCAIHTADNIIRDGKVGMVRGALSPRRIVRQRVFR